jgi:hypothetical protein
LGCPSSDRLAGNGTNPSIEGTYDRSGDSLSGPRGRFSGPSGDYWELYASKTRLPTWGEAAIHISRSGDPIFDIPIVVFSVLWGLLVAPLLFVIVLLPLAVVRGRRSRAIRIEAVRTFPEGGVLLWTTTDGSRRRPRRDRSRARSRQGLATGRRGLLGPRGGLSKCSAACARI